MKRAKYAIEDIAGIFDCEVQNRGMPYCESSYAIFYCWMNGGRTDIGLEKGDLLTYSYYGKIRLNGKIDAVDRTYYGGTCPVVYMKLSPASMRKWLAYRAERFGNG